MARAELGPAALVLSTRMVAARGLRGLMGARVVEVTAVADRQVSETRLPHEGHRPAPVASSPRAALRRATPAPDADVEGPPARPAWQEGLIARLCATGLDRALAADVAATIPTWRRRAASLGPLRHAMTAQFESLTAGGEAHAPIELFVGAPGVGKTTTIAKIAAQERVRRGARLTLVAADGFRVGAVEQLRLYADIIGSPFVVARSPEELARALDTARGPVLVDTAGRSPRDAEATALFEILASRQGVRTHLVLPASTSPREAGRLLESFRSARPDRLVLTRADEATSVAPLVGFLRDHRLKASYLGIGQRVPEDLEQATATALADRVLGEPAGALA
jgi:flagellar biosynthesis protein FlhF